MRVLVCGGRDYANAYTLNRVLDEIEQQECAGRIDVLIHGAARGADLLAEEWARRRKRLHPEAGPEIKRYPALWKLFGKKAGAIRNSQMLDEGYPDLVVAFPGGRGTRDMVERAKRAGVRVIMVSNDGW